MASNEPERPSDADLLNYYRTMKSQPEMAAPVQQYYGAALKAGREVTVKDGVLTVVTLSGPSKARYENMLEFMKNPAAFREHQPGREEFARQERPREQAVPPRIESPRPQPQAEMPVQRQPAKPSRWDALKARFRRRPRG